MGRWAPDASGRLAQAAMELYRERGFDATTVAETTEQAGLTERTFFRHFADKHEVLFWGAAALEDFLVKSVDRAPAALPPLEAIAAALCAAAADVFEEQRDGARQRRAIINANAELQEREQVKMTAIGSAIAGALRRRGVGDLAASLAAQAGVAVFRTAFEDWIRDGSERTLAECIQASMAELRNVVAAGTSPLIA